MMSNEEKKRQLGMALGTARNKLQKKLMFMFAQRCGMDKCFQCGKKIDSLFDLSIEHKEPWLHSNNPLGLYMNTDNVAFSHLSCNIRASRNAPAKGEDSGVSRITEDIVLVIKHSNESTSVLAKRYSISTRHIRGLRAGASWKHLNGR